jgi:hypothetical protein
MPTSGAGHEVQEKVRVSSGIVDAIATRDGKRIVIEAKGEDSGRTSGSAS